MGANPKTKAKEPKPIVTIEDAERVYAQAWPMKLKKVGEEVKAALGAIGQKHGVIIDAKINATPAFLTAKAQKPVGLPKQP